MSKRVATGSIGAVTPEKAVASLPLQVVVGRQLCLLRSERGLSRETLAARLGLPVGHIAEHESGARRIGVNQLLSYASLLGVRVSAFFSEPPAAAVPAAGPADPSTM